MEALKIIESEMYEIDSEFLLEYQSEDTRNGYKRDLEQFIEYIHALRKNFPKEVERADIINFRNSLADAGGQAGSAAAPKTINRKLASLSSYFKFLVEKRIMEHNPAASVRRPKNLALRPTNDLSDEQMENILEFARKNKTCGKLHYALLLTYFTSGLRSSEVSLRQKKDIKSIDGYMALEYKGKGGKVGLKYFPQRTKDAIEEYLLWMKEIGRPHHKEDWLFQPVVNRTDPTNLNKPLRPKSIRRIIQRYAKLAGVLKSVSTHSTRATYISSLLEKGVDIYAVSREVNHSSVKTTQGYDRRKVDKSKEIAKLLE